MAGHSRYTALLDACVLFPLAVCDALMSVAATGIYAAKWTRRIDEEWTRNLEAYKGLPPGTFDLRRDQMRLACPDWEVTAEAWQPLEAALDLPDPGDRHVLAAALAGHADCIVTSNLVDFPSTKLEPMGIDVLHPDAFLLAQLELDPFRVLPAFRDMRRRLRNPAMDAMAFTQALQRNGLVETADYLHQAADLI